MVDNLAVLVMQLVDTVTERTSQRRIAVVADVRGGVFFRELRGALDELAARGVRPHVLFLEAGDEVLVRRFESAGDRIRCRAKGVCSTRSAGA